MHNAIHPHGVHQPVPVAEADFCLGLAVLAASGMAALGHEVLWTRRMMDVLGASAESSVRVFACFFLGLCLGAAVIAFLLPGVSRPWRDLGCVELGVALLSLPALFLPHWTDWIWRSLGPVGLMSWQGSAMKGILCALVVLPPAFLMGMTLPLLVSAVFTTRVGHSGREIVLYAANTFGGVLGIGLVLLASLRWLGAMGSMCLMMGVNVVVAIICFLRDWRMAPQPERLDSPGGRPRAVGASSWSDVLPILFAFFSGAGVLALEVLGLALVNLSVPLSFYPQGSILLCVIFLLALAAVCVAVWVRQPGQALRVLPVFMAAAGVAAALAPLLFLLLPGRGLGLLGYGNTFGQFFLRLAGYTVVSLGPAVLLAGMVFPLILLWARRERSPPGRQMGWLLALSGLGGIAGTEIAFRFLLPAFAVHASMGVVGMCYGVASLVLLCALKERDHTRYFGPLIALLAAGYLTLVHLVGLPVFLEADRYELVDLRVGREGSLAVVEDGRGRFLVFDNQYTLGGTEVTPSLRRQAHLPLMLHPSPANVGFIGLGTGITASGALEHEAVESITVLELSPLVADVAARHFGRFNHGICRNPRVTIQIEDARIYLESCPESFDVIVGDLFTPWRPGEASLSSLEAFRAARSALRKGGVFCQWIELSQWTPDQFQAAAATFRSVFGHVGLFRAGFEIDRLPVGLVGFREGGLDWSAVARRCALETHEGRLVDPLCRHVEGVAMLYLGEFVPGTEFQNRINTLDNLRIELSAGRRLIFTDAAPYYDGSSEGWLKLLGQQAAAAQSDLPDPLCLSPMIGVLATRFEIALAAKDLGASAIARSLADQIPSNVRNDSGADWALWPGSTPPWWLLGIPGP